MRKLSKGINLKSDKAYKLAVVIFNTSLALTFCGGITALTSVLVGLDYTSEKAKIEDNISQSSDFQIYSRNKFNEYFYDFISGKISEPEFEEKFKSLDRNFAGYLKEKGDEGQLAKIENLDKKINNSLSAVIVGTMLLPFSLVLSLGSKVIKEKYKPTEPNDRCETESGM